MAKARACRTAASVEVEPATATVIVGGDAQK
jgi:hypothetical protein